MFNDFIPFSKIPRLNSECRITEKIDGTNACVEVVGDDTVGYAVRACSRERVLVTVGLSMEPMWSKLDAKGRGVDNYGFGAWVVPQAVELALLLGPGRHFGEWWGQGIQRRYDLTEKRFSMFFPPAGVGPGVPVLYEGPFSQSALDGVLDRLRRDGSYAAPGFMRPEGVVVTFKHGGSFKVILNEDATKANRLSPDPPAAR